jgi:hypothetical protein
MSSGSEVEMASINAVIPYAPRPDLRAMDLMEMITRFVAYIKVKHRRDKMMICKIIYPI